MNELQSNLFHLVSEIDDICKKNDIQYFLAGGTALGTVRNHCFLPWDDDLDLYITRDNWNKLRAAVEKDPSVIPEGRSLIYMENTPYYCNPIPRYVDNTTTAIYKSQALPGKACGQHIELLIMDPMPVDEKEKEEYIKLLKVYTELISPYFVVNKFLSIEDFKKHYKLYNKYYWKAKFLGLDRVLKSLEEKLLKYDESTCEYYCMRWGITILMYKSADYGKGRLELFEDRPLPVGENAEGIFRIAYGDSWMYVPEGEEQVIHNALQDIHIPFNEYTDEYIPKVNREKVFKAYKKKKRSNMKVFINRRKQEKAVAKSRILINGTKICEMLQSKEAEIVNAYEKKDYDYLNQTFGEYYGLQMDSNVRRYGLFVPVSDKILEIAMLNLIEQGKYFNVNKYIRLIPADATYQGVDNLKDLVEKIRNLSVAIYDLRDISLVNQAIDALADHQDLLDVYRAKLWVMEQEAAEDVNAWKDIEALAIEASEKYPFDGEVLFYVARAKQLKGEEQAALEIYNKVIANTRNGLVWEKVKNNCGLDRISQEAK